MTKAVQLALKGVQIGHLFFCLFLGIFDAKQAKIPILLTHIHQGTIYDEKQDHQ
jgi:hypothetical protein